MEHGPVLIDIGPNLVTVLLALISAVGATAAAYFSFHSKKQLDAANGQLKEAFKPKVGDDKPQ